MAYLERKDLKRYKAGKEKSETGNRKITTMEKDNSGEDKSEKGQFGRGQI